MNGPDPVTNPITVTRQNPWTTAWTTGRAAARQNWIPAIFMWFFGIAVVAGYFLWPMFHDWLNQVGNFKQLYGWRFSLVSTAVFGGLLPSLIAIAMGTNKGQVTPGLIISNTLLWAYKGVEIDLFYQLQSRWFGTTADIQTIALKTICDQFLMVPLFGLVNVVLFYAWREAGYSIRGFFSSLGPNWYRVRVLPVLIANWFIWIPAVILIYGLPSALQLPMQNLILCFWALVLMVFSKTKPQER